MLVSVAICTWNRAALLDRTLEQMRLLRIPRGVEWELLIVNNCCTDATDEVIQRHANWLPIRRLQEDQAGQSHARNCAIRAAKGKVIIWTDDDVLVDPGWLQAYVAAAEAWPEYSFFGGTISPWYESNPPALLGKNLDLLKGVFVILELGDQVRPLNKSESPFGANMGFRRHVFENRQFNTRLGHKGSEIVGGEDAELIERLRQDGIKGLWIGPARVQHFIPAQRFSWEYLFRWFDGSGQCAARMIENEAYKKLCGYPRWAVRQYIVASLKLILWSAFRNRSWLKARLSLWHLNAMFREFRALKCSSQNEVCESGTLSTFPWPPAWQRSFWDEL